MQPDTSHLKTILIIGLGLTLAGVVALTWVYPAFCQHFNEVQHAATRDFCEVTYGVSDESWSLLGSSASFSREVARTVGGDEPRTPSSGPLNPAKAYGVRAHKPAVAPEKAALAPESPAPVPEE